MTSVVQVPSVNASGRWYYTVYYRPPDGLAYKRVGEVHGHLISADHQKALGLYLEEFSLPYAGDAIVFGPNTDGVVTARTFEISAPPRSYRINET